MGGVQHRRRVIDRVLKVLFKVPEAKPGGADPFLCEGLLDQRLELDDSKLSNRTLPAVPNEAFILRLKLPIAGLKEPTCFFPGQSAVDHYHGKRFAHARADE